MAVLLSDVAPPIREVAKLGYAAVAVYSLLFESAHRDRNFERTGNGMVVITGGTSHWSHKALAETLRLGKATVIRATDALLDNGFIQVIGYVRPPKGSLQRVYRVIHPHYVQNQHHVLEIIGEPASERQRRKDRFVNSSKARSFEELSSFEEILDSLNCSDIENCDSTSDLESI